MNKKIIAFISDQRLAEVSPLVYRAREYLIAQGKYDQMRRRRPSATSRRQEELAQQVAAERFHLLVRIVKLHPVALAEFFSALDRALEIKLLRKLVGAPGIGITAEKNNNAISRLINHIEAQPLTRIMLAFPRKRSSKFSEKHFAVNDEIIRIFNNAGTDKVVDIVNSWRRHAPRRMNELAGIFDCCNWGNVTVPAAAKLSDDVLLRLMRETTLKTVTGRNGNFVVAEFSFAADLLQMEDNIRYIQLLSQMHTNTQNAIMKTLSKSTISDDRYNYITSYLLISEWESHSS